LDVRDTVFTVRWLIGFAAAALLFLSVPVNVARADDYPPSSTPPSTTVNTVPPGLNQQLLRGSIDNSRPTAGTTTTVVGQGFEAGESVAISVRSTHTDLGEAVSGADGTLSLTFVVPSSMHGEQSITLTGLHSGRVASIGVTFIVPPGTVQDDNATSIAVAIVGVGGLGVVLIAGGVALLVVGRRHAVGDVAVAE
jgi:hypothetical protein